MKKITDYSLILIGTALTAAAFALFLIPSGAALGGVTGAAVLLGKLIPLKLSLLVLAINTVLLLTGWHAMGTPFVIKTLLSSALFPVLLEILQGYSASLILQSPLFCSVAGGFLLGLGNAMVLAGNGSCGGLDLIAVLLSRILPLSVPVILNLLTCTVIVLQKPSPAGAVCGILAIFAATLTIDLFEKIRRSETAALAE